MPARRARTIECRRRGCRHRMRPRDTFCAACWSAVPGWLKAALAAARRAADPALVTGLMIKASDFAAAAACLDAKLPPPTATQAYANTARLLGERDEGEAA